MESGKIWAVPFPVPVPGKLPDTDSKLNVPAAPTPIPDPENGASSLGRHPALSPSTRFFATLRCRLRVRRSVRAPSPIRLRLGIKYLGGSEKNVQLWLRNPGPQQYDKQCITAPLSHLVPVSETRPAMSVRQTATWRKRVPLPRPMAR